MIIEAPIKFKEIMNRNNNDNLKLNLSRTLLWGLARYITIGDSASIKEMIDIGIK